MNKIGKEKAVELINNSKGRFITVTFKKKDNTIRSMNCIRITKNKDSLGYIAVYDVQKKKYRKVNSQTITSLTLNKKSYKI